MVFQITTSGGMVAIEILSGQYSTPLFLIADNQKVTLFTNLTESKLSHVKALAGF